MKNAAKWLVAIAVMIWLLLALADFGYPSPCWHCTNSEWVVTLNGYTVNGTTSETEEECRELIKKLDPQTPPFSDLDCKKVGVVKFGT